jgi:multidrug efflux system outer membrane protein
MGALRFTPSRTTRSFACAALACVAFLAPRAVHAGPLDDDDEKSEAKKDAGDELPKQPLATMKPHAYTLKECLFLADRNAPHLWAARARLGVVHGQLDEAKWTPFSYWSANATFGYLPPIGGTAFYNATPYTALYRGFGDGWQPAFSIGVSGTVPIYTFNKIESIRKAAEANVRVTEWDLEKTRIQIRADVRRAYYGLMLARDMLYIGGDVLKKLDKGIEGVTTKLQNGEPSVEEADRLRLEIQRDELVARMGEAKKGEAYAIAGLRFLTGVQSAFEIPDAPLERPAAVLGPVVRYLTAARLFRPDINMARAGVQARRQWLEFNRAQLFPNLGLGLGFNYSIAPSAAPQTAAWIGDPFNRFGYSIGLGFQWGLDILPKQARISQAESQLEEARANERYALGGVAVEVENAYATAVEAKSREESWDRAEHRAKRWITSVQDAIDLGTRDERFLIEPLRSYVFARANHAQALMDLHVALSELARVTGWDDAAPPT